MNRYTFFDRAREFAFSRKRVLELLDKDDIADIRIATLKGTFPEYREAIIEYLNALINGDVRIYNFFKDACGEEIFQKLVKAGLKRIT